MLQPKKTKHKKQQKGRSKKRMKETRGFSVKFGKFGIQAVEGAWITANQIESARKTIAHSLKREGKVWIRIFPDKPITKFPPEVTMGGGKGSVDHYVVPVKPGRILFEIDGVSEKVASEAFRKAGHKMPIKTRVIAK